MAELTLEPYAVVQHWRLAEAAGHWETILAEYLQTVAERCVASGPAVIGHIKALALFPEGQYLRLSVVAPHLPATVTGQVPPGCAALDLTLNVLVYGLDRTRIEQITQDAAQATATAWKGDVSHAAISPLRER